jgi:DNA gyrase subunit A
VSAKITNGRNHVFLCSKDGMSIRFNEEEVRPMGRTARGVIGMSLDPGDRLVAMEVLDAENTKPFEVLTITESGYGKRTPVAEYRLQSRGGKGVITMKTNDRNGAILGARQVLPKDDVMLVSNKGQMIRVHVGEISEQGRNTQGVRVMSMSAGEKVVSVEYMAEAAAAAEGDETGGIPGNGTGPGGAGSGASNGSGNDATDVVGGDAGNDSTPTN